MVIQDSTGRTGHRGELRSQSHFVFIRPDRSHHFRIPGNPVRFDYCIRPGCGCDVLSIQEQRPSGRTSFGRQMHVYERRFRFGSERQARTTPNCLNAPESPATDKQRRSADVQAERRKPLTSEAAAKAPQASRPRELCRSANDSTRRRAASRTHISTRLLLPKLRRQRQPAAIGIASDRMPMMIFVWAAALVRGRSGRWCCGLLVNRLSVRFRSSTAVREFGPN